MSTRFIQGSPVDYQGRTDGAVVPAGYLGEISGTSRSGTGYQTYSVRTTTVPTTSGVQVIDTTLNKGVYLIVLTSRMICNSAGAWYLDVRAGTERLHSQFAYLSVVPANYHASKTAVIPVVITANGTSINCFETLEAGTSTGAEHELWVIRIA